MSDIELIRAELKVAELEQALLAAKADGSVTSELKLELREARQAFRELRGATGTAAPDTINAKVKG